ncbi:hypothetical protein Btru_063140 [Bulinus truncatus]|nr:hypothetical protein Btru_063140 [Bulinus truncatus]
MTSLVKQPAQHQYWSNSLHNINTGQTACTTSSLVKQPAQHHYWSNSLHNIITGFNGERTTISDEDIKESIDYFNKNSPSGTTRLVIWFVECTPRHCSHELDQNINTTMFSSDDLNLLFLVNNQWNLNTFSGKLRLDNVIQIKYFQIHFDRIYLKLCGRCSPGLVDYHSKQIPYTQSCYYLGNQKNSTRYQYESDCDDRSSEIVNIETNAELTYLTDVLGKRMFSNRTGIHSSDIDVLFVHLGQRYSNNKLTKTRLKRDINRNILETRVQEECLVLKLEKQSESNSSSVERISASVESLPCSQSLPSIVMCEDNFIGDWINDIEFDMNYFDDQTHVINNDFLFDCDFGGQLIHYYEVCDGVVNCNYARDEKYCFHDDRKHKGKGFGCIVDLFGVTVDGVIPEEYRCNGHEDCLDGSDEMDCDTCDEMNCLDGTCLPKHWFDPGNNECRFRETNVVSAVEVDPHNIRCSDEDCVYPQQLTLGVTICNNQTNEWAPRCVYLKSRNGWPMGCNDLSHLENCEDFKCPKDLVKCPFSYCIPFHYLNDFVLDCVYGEDESNAVSISDNDLKRCLKSQLNIGICDGKKDCENMSDELDCHSYCATGFKCQAGVVLVDDYDTSKPFKHLSRFDGRTKKFDLSGVNLSTISNEELTKFNQLLELNMSNCSLHKDTFLDFKEMNDKIYLVDISYNNIRAITKQGMLSKLLNVKILNLSHNTFLETIDAEGIVTPTILFFDLSYTQISFFYGSFLQKSKIYHLFLQHTKINSLTWLPSNFHLSYLNLQNTHLYNDNVRKFHFKNASITDKLLVDHYTLCCPAVTGPGIPSHVCQSPGDPISSCDGLIGDLTKKVFIWIMSVLSTVGNTFVLTHLYLDDKASFKYIYGLFLTNLSVADFLMALYLTTIGSVDIFYQDSYILYERAWRYSPLCKFCGFLSTLSSEVSVFFVSLLTFERFLTFCFSSSGHTYNKLTLMISVVIPWGCGFFIALLPIIFDHWTIYSSNGMCRSLPLAGKDGPGWMYSLTILVVFKLIFFTLIASGQAAIFIAAAVKKVSRHNPPWTENEINVARQCPCIFLMKSTCDVVSFYEVMHVSSIGY